jgi:hypothetical protein
MILHLVIGFNNVNIFIITLHVKSLSSIAFQSAVIGSQIFQIVLHRLILLLHQINLRLQTITLPLGTNDVKQIDIVNKGYINQIEQKGQQKLVPKEFDNHPLHVSKFQ